MELSIGDLARLSGLPVKTIRYYSDIGVVPEAGRTRAGYRRYDQKGLARLELVRVLRELGLDLDSVRRVVERPTTLEEIARAQAAAIDLRIHQLTLRRAVLRAIARGMSRPEEVRRMTAYAQASADEARRMLEDFVDAVFVDHEDNPFAERMRAAIPVLPDQPTDAQLDAWIELATLIQDRGFLDRVRRMVAEGARQRAAQRIGPDDPDTQRAGSAVVDRAGQAIAAGVAPGTPEAATVVDEVTPLFAAAAGRENTNAYRGELAQQLETFSDGRVERYWQLLATINGWPVQPALMPAYQWFIAALKAR
jgi:DNA-binding transcriptional MerR regulator